MVVMFAVIIGAYIFALLVDLYNIFGISDMLYQAEQIRNPLMINLLFGNGRPIEIINYIYLAGAATLFSFAAGVYYAKKKTHKIWLYFSFFMILLILEDAGDLSKLIGEHIEIVTDGFGSFELRAFTFAFLGLFALFIIVKYRNYILGHMNNESKLYLMLAYIFYGLAAAFSMTGNIFGWYEPVGEFILKRMFDGALWHYEITGLGQTFMDTTIEETLEYFAAGFFVILAITIYENSKDDSEPREFR